jgi:carbohydrate-binding DOMON domain-containing protein
MHLLHPVGILFPHITNQKSTRFKFLLVGSSSTGNIWNVYHSLCINCKRVRGFHVSDTHTITYTHTITHTHTQSHKHTHSKSHTPTYTHTHRQTHTHTQTQL